MHGFEMGILQAKQGTLFIHQLNECRLATCHIIRHRDTGIVARINDDTTAEIANRDPVTWL
ncbi:hypothetical protein D3C71_1261970 [compost metagenome]